MAEATREYGSDGTHGVGPLGSVTIRRPVELVGPARVLSVSFETIPYLFFAYSSQRVQSTKFEVRMAFCSKYLHNFI